MKRLILLCIFGILNLFPLLLTAQTGWNLDLVSRWGYGTCQAVSVYGSYLYIGNGNELETYQIQGTRPDLVKQSRILLPGPVYDITVPLGTVAYVACGTSGLVLVNVATPSAPADLGTCDTDGEAVGVTVEGNYAYVADGDNGLAIVNVTAPSNPVLVGTFSTGASVQDVWVAGDTAYVASSELGLFAIDVHQKNAPAFLDSVDTPGIAKAVFVSGNDAYVADGDSGMSVVDIIDASNLARTDSWTSGTPQDITDISGVVTGKAYLTDALFGIWVLDVSGTPSLFSNAVSVGTPLKIAFRQNHAFVAVGGRGMTVWNVAGTDPSPVDTLSTGDEAWDVLLDGSIAYVADARSGLWILDASQSSADSVHTILHVDSLRFCSALAKWDTLLFVANGPAGVDILDVSSPGSPVLVSVVPGSSWATDVAVDGPDKKLLIADMGNGLRVVDFTDPYAPVPLGMVPFAPDSTFRVTIDTVRNIAYVAKLSAGVSIVDPEALTVISNLTGVSESYAAAPAMHGDTLLYVADGSAGLKVFNVADSTAPTELPGLAYDTPGTAWDVVAEGQTILIADGEGTIRMVSSGEEVGNYHSGAASVAMDLDNDTLSVAEGKSGILLLRVNFAGHLVSLTDSLDFARVVVNKQRTLLAEFINTGTTEVTIGSVGFSTGVFECGETFPQVLSPGDTIRIGVTYQPIFQGESTDSLIVESDSDNSPLSVPIQGQGIDAVALEAYSPDVFTYVLYHMDIVQGDTLLVDDSDYGILNSDVSGAILTEPGQGCFGAGLDFDADDVVEGTVASLDSFPPFNGVTMELWFRLDQEPAGRKILTQSVSISQVFLELAVDETLSVNRLVGRVVPATLDTLDLASDPDMDLQIGQWYHAALTYRDRAKLFLNGALVDSTAGGGPVAVAGSLIFLIGNDLSRSQTFPGTIDEFRLSGLDREPWEFNVCSGRIDVSSERMDFGSVLLSRSRTLNATVENLGEGMLWVDSLRMDDPQVEVSPTSFTLASGQARWISVTYTPTSTTFLLDTLRIYSRDPNSPLLSLPLSGEGVAGRPTGAYAVDVYTTGLFHFDETSGDTTYDDSDSELIGVLEGSNVGWSTAATRFGPAALTFSGTDGWVRVPYDNVLNPVSNPFTVETWFRLDSRPASGQYFVLLRHGLGTGLQSELVYGDSALAGSGLKACVIGSSGGIFTLEGPPDVEMGLDTWTHVAVTWDESMLRLYINGLCVDSLACTGILRSSTADVAIGGSYGTGRTFQGLLDEVRFSSTARLPWEFNVAGPNIGLSTQILSFGQILVGESSALTLTVSNGGDQPLVVSNADWSSEAFSIDPASFTVPVGSSQILDVVFTPEESGFVRDTLFLVSNDFEQDTVDVVLQGTGMGYRNKEPYGLDDNTVALWHFEETTGLTQAQDATGRGHIGTLSSGVSRIDDGYFTKGIRFNGTSGSMTLVVESEHPFNPDTMSTTVECFFRTDTVSQALFWGDHFGPADVANNGLRIDEEGRLDLAGYGVGPRVNDNAWHHVALICDADIRRVFLYLDGVLQLDVEWPSGGAETADQGTFLLGTRLSGTAQFVDWFEGDMDEVRISDIARAPWEFTFLSTGIQTAWITEPSMTGQAQTVRITVPYDTLTKTVTLYAREGGQSAYTDLTAAEIDSVTFQAVIPAGSATVRGIEYYVEKRTASDTVTAPLYDPIRRPLSKILHFAGTTSAVSLSAKKYAMVSVPAVLDHPGVYDVLHDDMGSSSPYTWRFFAWNDTSYAEFSDTLSTADSLLFRFDQGRAFWIIPAATKTFDADSGTTAYLASSYSFTLDPQWNMVGSPFPFSVAWDDCALTSDSIGTLYYYDGSGYRLDWTSFEPWKGYWIYNSSPEPVTLQVPPRQATLPKEIPPQNGILRDLAEGDWLWKISAEVEGSQDLDNFAGIRSNAESEWDVLDRMEPPPIGDHVTLFFDHSEWASHPGYYASDIRNPGETGYRWEFVVRTTHTRKTVRMSWTLVQNLSEGWVGYLIDEDEGLGTAMLEKTGVNFESPSKALASRRFTVLVGPSAYVEQESGIPLVPVEFALMPNFPNPFNPETTIRFSLPRNGRAVLTVYNLLGQAVRLLADEAQKTGFYEVRWDGLNDHGMPVSSGMYMVRLEFQGRIAVRKMVLIR